MFASVVGSEAFCNTIPTSLSAYHAYCLSGKHADFWKHKIVSIRVILRVLKHQLTGPHRIIGSVACSDSWIALLKHSGWWLLLPMHPSYRQLDRTCSGSLLKCDGVRDLCPRCGWLELTNCSPNWTIAGPTIGGWPVSYRGMPPKYIMYRWPMRIYSCQRGKMHPNI